MAGLRRSLTASNRSTGCAAHNNMTSKAPEKSLCMDLCRQGELLFSLNRIDIIFSGLSGKSLHARPKNSTSFFKYINFRASNVHITHDPNNAK